MQLWPRLLVQLSSRCIMDNLSPVKSFLKEIIEPIVIEAVKSAIPSNDSQSDNEYLSVEEIQQQYHISSSTIYRRFATGDLTKVKNGNRTLVRKSEIESGLKEGKLVALDDKMYKKYGRK